MNRGSCRGLITASLAAVSLLATGSCASGRSAGTASEVPSTPSRATDSVAFEGHGISFDYPAEWDEQRPLGPERTAWTVTVGPRGTYGYVSLFAYEFPGELAADALERFASNVFRFVELETSKDERVGGVTKIALDGEAAIEQRFWRPPMGTFEGADIRAIVVRHGSLFMAIECFAPVGGDVGAGCDEVIESFAFTE